MAKDEVEDFIEKMGLAKGNYYIILQDVGDDKFKKAMIAYEKINPLGECPTAEDIIGSILFFARFFKYSFFSFLRLLTFDFI